MVSWEPDRHDVSGWKLLHFIEEVAHNVEIMNEEVTEMQKLMGVQVAVNKKLIEEIEFLKFKKTCV